MRITVLYSDDNGCDYHRLILPSTYMQLGKEDSIKLVHHKHCPLDANIFDCDILFFSRLFFFEWESLRRLQKRFGFKVVVDVDDYYELYKSHILYDSWIRNNTGDKVLESVRNADFVFVTNEQLRKAYKPFNDKIEIVPNSLPFERGLFLANKIPSDKIRFLYVAGSTHYDDLNSIRGLFRRLSSDGEFRQKAKFVLCGYHNEKNSRNVWDKMESLCKINGAYERRGTIPLKEYIKHYDYGDVSIAPLVDNKFNNGKSNLKFVEAACKKHPFICSDILPYVIDKNKEVKGILFCNNTQDWYQSFKYFVKNPQAIEDYGNFNFEYAKKYYNLADANKKRYQIFKSLL